MPAASVLSPAPTTAMQICGERMNVEKLYEILMRDFAFFKVTGGGVTLSGGETLAQPRFAAALLKRLKSIGVHTAVETSGAAPWTALEQIAPLTDIFLYDIKHMNSEQHKSGTGVDNLQILDNLDRLMRSGARVIVRFPLIPGYNDHPDNVLAAARLVRTLNIEEIHLLPYHRLGAAKYAGLGRAYAMEDASPAENDKTEAIQKLLRDNTDVKVVIGG